MNPFHPTWYTIPEFAAVTPVRVYHKEQADAPNPPEAIRNLHVLARAALAYPGGPLVLRITADDYYKLYVNGSFVCQGPAPAYPEAYYYNTVDLAPYLHTGENTVAVHLYYQGLLNRVWNSHDRRFGVAADVSCETGAPRALLWKYRISPAYSGGTTGYDTQFLENFDSRLWEEDWNRPAYDDSAWEPMVPAQWADYTLRAQPVKLLDVSRWQPRETRREKGRWFLDFGQEITGALDVTAAGKAGDRVVLRCGEECNPDGTVRYDLRCNCRYEEVWTLGDGVSRLHPYDYKAFRYAELLFDEGVEIRQASATVRHYPMDGGACTLRTGDRSLDAIFSICKNGVKFGTQEAFLDCPSREKGQYLGDSVVTAHAHVWLTGSVDMLRKCIDQFAQTKAICPGLMGVAPGGLMQEIADFSLLWSQLLLLDYQFTGDRAFLRAYYPAAKGILRHFAQYARPDGLLEQVADKWNLVDWPENLRDGYDFPLTRPVVAPGCHNVVNALYVGAAQTLSKIEGILGLPESTGWETLRQAYVRAFYRPGEKRFADSETSAHTSLHANVYALYFGLEPAGAEQPIADFLLEKGLCCGVLVSYFYLKALARAGRFADEYRTLVNESEHGWVNMLREGATTCWEAWGKDQKWNTSLCHPWASAPVPVLIEDIAGFLPDPAQPEGFRFSPHVPQNLAAFSLRVPFRGRSYRIEKENGQVVLREETD